MTNWRQVCQRGTPEPPEKKYLNASSISYFKQTERMKYFKNYCRHFLLQGNVHLFILATIRTKSEVKWL